MTTLKDLKNKVSQFLPEIMLGTALTVIATAAVVVVVKVLKSPIPTATGSYLNAAETIDLTNPEHVNILKKMIDVATEASVISIDDGRIIFLS